MYQCHFACVYLCFVYAEDLSVSVNDQRKSISEVAAGGNNSDYLDLAKKGGGHKGITHESYY